jgi:hypothetical protein
VGLREEPRKRGFVRQRFRLVRLGGIAMRKVVTLGLLLIVSTPAFAWNDKGHMVAARLAWKKLTEEERSKVLEILKKHPHYVEFLTTKRPDGFSEDEWDFMRAATWPDWVRTHQKGKYHHAP